MTPAEALKRYGSQSNEYRTAWRREYREANRRIDYYPNGKASQAIDMALERRWAVSYGDAINQALRAWADWMADDTPE